MNVKEKLNIVLTFLPSFSLEGFEMKVETKPLTYTTKGRMAIECCKQIFFKKLLLPICNTLTYYKGRRLDLYSTFTHLRIFICNIRKCGEGGRGCWIIRQTYRGWWGYQSHPHARIRKNYGLKVEQTDF